MVKIHVESRTRKDLLKNKVNKELISGLHTAIVNSVIWRTQYNIEQITRELHEFGRQIGESFYPLLSKALDTKDIENPSKYMNQLWNIVFSKKPDNCKWDKKSNQLIITTKSCGICPDISEQVYFPFSETIAGLIEAVVELTMEDIKGRFSSLDISCHESECKVRNGTPYCRFVLSIRGETTEQ